MIKKIFTGLTLLIFISLIISISVIFYKASNPIYSVYHKNTGSLSAKNLIVILPGLVDEPEDFVVQGFIDIAHKSKEPVDIVITDANLWYYLRFNLIERLKHDVFLPAKEMGYKNIWIAGFSMGGSGALIYAMCEPHDISGILAIGPFLGQDYLIDNIYTVGGLSQWNPGEDLYFFEFDKKVWKWLKDYTNDPPHGLRIFLGYGLDDNDIKRSNRLLCDALPAEQVITVQGGHEWEPWRKIFSEFVNSKIFRAMLKE